jgi:hypothetical protein
MKAFTSPRQSPHQSAKDPTRRGTRWPRAGRVTALLAVGGATVALAGTAVAAPDWVITPSVDPSAQKAPFSNVLTAVGARTSTDAWAVGEFLGGNDDDGQVMLAERWNGSAWSQVATPNVVHFDEKLLGVSPAAANDVWAVGSTNRISFAHTDPITAHFDGTTWSIVPTPASTGAAKSILFAVANLGGGSAWAVGRSHDARALIERWDGSAWTVVPHPDPVGPAGSTLNNVTLTGISARSASDIWAVGNYSTLTGVVRDVFTLTMHWNGTAWSVVPSPNPGTRSPVNGQQQVLNGVVEISPTDAWAVGNTIDTVSGSFQAEKPIAFHWNGTAWSNVAVPGLAEAGLLSSVTASSPTAVWAAGRVGNNTLILRWNGTAWSRETSPNGPDGETLLSGITSVPGSATEVWSAGVNLPTTSGYHTFVVHHP